MAHYNNYFRPTLRLQTFTPDEFFDGTLRESVITSDDIITIPSVYDLTTYQKLAKELFDCNEKNNEKLLIPWHKGNHLIANDKFANGSWKKDCEVMNKIINDMCVAFNVMPNATRVNIYCKADNGFKAETKPFHYDRAAFTPGLTQNITMAASFGATREIGFRFSKYKSEPSQSWKNVPKGMGYVNLSVPCRNGSIYAFTRDVNCKFQHAVMPEAPHICGDNSTKDRISIIVWGTKMDLNIDDSTVSERQIPTPNELGVSDKKR
jgi:hypothetical protein